MPWFVRDTPLVKKYRKYRSASVDLHTKIMQGLNEQVYKEATGLLGVRKGKMIVLDEDELPSVMDFALYDCRWQGKNAVELYQEEAGEERVIERELLAAMLSAYTSLFRLEYVRKAEKTLTFTDLLAAESDPVKIIDIGLSETAVPGLLVFFRLVSLADFNLSSGASFIFPPDKESYLLRQYQVIMRKVKSEDTAVQRFVAFFKLNQRIGLERGYE